MFEGACNQVFLKRYLHRIIYTLVSSFENYVAEEDTRNSFVQQSLSIYLTLRKSVLPILLSHQ
jgi:hypothetical protein